MAANQVIVLNPASTSSPDGSIIQASAGRQNETLVSEVHGKWYTAGYRGATFMTSTLIAGITIPVAAATLNSKFTIWNPAGSGKMCELISCQLGLSAATTVVTTIGLAIQKNLSGTSGPPTAPTTQYALPLGVGGQAAVGAYAQLTLTNVAIPGVSAATAVPIPFYPMFYFGAVTNVGANTFEHCFDGRIILQPDSLVAVCDSVGTALTAVIGMTWAEWPV